MARRKCRCSVDQDGQCVGCRSLMLALGSDFISLMTEMDRKVELLRNEYQKLHQAMMANFLSENQDLCDPCSRRYIDLMFSKVIASFGSSSPTEAQSACGAVTAIFKKRVPSLKMPLTALAWKKIKADRKKK